MSKVYTVKSNARRDARKLGLDPDAVVAVDGGFIIGGEPKAVNRITAIEPAASESVAGTAASKKNAVLLTKLESGWVAASDLMNDLGWQAHTLRGAISTLAKKRSVVVERRRVAGVTSYRVAQ